jgi:hypothetical protein
LRFWLGIEVLDLLTRLAANHFGFSFSFSTFLGLAGMAHGDGEFRIQA